MTFARLFKVLFKENFSLKRLFGFPPGANKVKTILISLAIVYGLGAVLFSFGYMFFDLGAALAAIDKVALLLSFAYVYAVGVTALFALMRANGYLFQYKDYGILGPLPIRSFVVVIVKMTIMMIVIYVPTLIITSPIAVAYFYYAGFDIVSLLMYAIGFLTIPLVPAAIVSFLSLVIARLTARMRHKNIVNIVIMLAILIGYMVISVTSAPDPDTNPLLGQATSLEGLTAVYWPAVWFLRAVEMKSWLDLGFLVGSHGLLFAIFLFVVARLAPKTNQWGQVVIARKRDANYQVQSQGVFATLVQKEFRKFFSVPMFALNSGLGVVMMLLFGLISLFSQTAVGQLLPFVAAAGLGPALIVLIFIGFCLAMTYTPAISLSLEGKNLWFIKSLPLDGRTIVYSKIVFNLFLIVPAALVAVVLFAIALEVPWPDMIGLWLWVLAFAALVSTFDAMLNLLFPKLDFINEIEVIKQSIASLFAVFGGFFLLAGNGLAYFFLMPALGSFIALMLVVALDIVLTVPIVLFINHQAEAAFEKCEQN